MQVIPSMETWDREVFLQARAKQIAAAEEMYRGREDVILSEPGDEIVCDWCNANIEGPTVQLVDFGGRAVCDDCYSRHYARSEVKYRVLNPDGSLGKYVSAGRSE